MVRNAYADSPRRLGIIYNAQSGRHRRRWGHHPLPTDVPAIEANTVDEIRAAVAELAARNIGLLAIAGGDGTVQCVLGELLIRQVFDALPHIALIPTGSTNMTANDAGFVDVRHDGWQPLCDWAAGKHPARLRERDVLRVTPADGSAPVAGMFFGAGAVHHAVEHTQKRLHSVGLRGEVGPALAFLRFIKSVITGDRRHFAPTPMTAHDDQAHRLSGDTLLIVVSTLHRLVLRFNPFWGRENAPMRWTAISHGAPRLFWRLPAVVRGKAPFAADTSENSGYTSHNSRTLELDFDGGYIVDGEFFTHRRGDGPLRLSVAGRITFVGLS
ncbi:diacylglycerol kinase family protein [uncultured Salinisphaera sp.]|uniref:diacylglycerol kinase family protein n=1 Tax=uncultured Salinisphaera sp. TaxID=359372 RepID=UPI0032B11164|tara:strand:+ start:8284 stop:9264 length:981 start_codon:yes stop_codon:yes gene_type:complete